VAIKDILRKLVSNRSEETGELRPRVTPNEVELAYFKERERQQNIKRELELYRKQESNNVVLGSSPLNEKQTILKSKNVFNSKNRLLNSKGIL